ncbi:MAG TPA: molecular chaperone DnaK [Rhodospirillaceae bacterium]|nr:molecular chaperone DnaK [Candidatus Neomarinimicrobiota bacterium]HCX15220.1 molecular chaperone DnaK [Rhodospirillaceae bacterium]
MDTLFFKAKLLTMRKEALSSRERTGNDRKPVELDQQAIGRLSRMDALQQQAMAIEAERRRSLQIGRIEAALKRIEDDFFGFCLICEEKIGEKRLTLDPTTPTCVKCADHGRST